MMTVSGAVIPPLYNDAVMDAHTLDLLEFDKVRQVVAANASTSLGRELAVRIEPGTNLSAIRAEIRLVDEMVAALGEGHAPPLAGIRDVRLVVRRAAIGTALAADQLLEVAETLTATGAIFRYRARLDERHTGLLDLLAGIEDLGNVAKTIHGCIDGRGHVLDMASRELAAVRQRLFELEEKVKAEVRRLLRDPELRKALSYPNATVNGDHYVLPVAVNFRHKVPGVVHRVSGTGETIYVEPASIAAMGAERVTLKSDEDREVKRVLRRLSAEVARVAKPLLYALDVLARLDLITAKARYSTDFAMTAPHFNTDGQVWLRRARHPVLEHLFRNESPAATKTVVPIDLRLGFGFNMLVITGPNTGGKTVTLKTTGLLALMAQAGLHIPADAGSTLPVFEQILADIGDEQSLEQSLSTFSSHMTRLATIFKTATAKSLVLLDELGAGTDPVEGAALGRAILDQLDHIGGRAMVTTHLGDLKTYAFNNDRAENAAVEFDIETLRPTYKLMIGQFGMSNALQIARRLKLPRDLIKRAHHYLRRRRDRQGDLAKLQELKRDAESAKVAALAAQLAADSERERLVEKQSALDRDAEAAAETDRWRESVKPGMTVHVDRFNESGTVVKVDTRKKTVFVSVGFGQWEVPTADIRPVITDAE
jgi:DNA mismatch repair protein MutS2